MVTATYLYSGMPDYWSGDSDRWDDNKGCLFAYYGVGTTVREIIDAAVEDFLCGGDCDTLPEEVTDSDIREALLDCLTEAGRRDYESGAVSEFAIEYTSVNNLDRCTECGERIGDDHDADCEFGDGPVDVEDCEPDDEFDASPVVIFLIEATVCEECGALCEHYIDELCIDCTRKHYPDAFDEDGKFIV